MKYLLNCSVYSYTKHDGCSVLFSSEIESDELAYLEDLLDSFSGMIHLNGEFNPKEPCIKFSSIIGYNDEKENLHIIKEKYVLFDLRTQCNDFWDLACKLKTYIH